MVATGLGAVKGVVSAAGMEEARREEMEEGGEGGEVDVWVGMMAAGDSAVLVVRGVAAAAERESRAGRVVRGVVWRAVVRKASEERGAAPAAERDAQKCSRQSTVKDWTHSAPLPTRRWLRVAS